ncbi:MAG: site-specific DNA-methyltransferase [Selenomonadaceae bacterium]|nr:site-specific DNA-methyltransferase [Selenomonadaceae bacterium]
MDSKIELIMKTFPECMIESRDHNGNLKHSIDFDVLRQILGDEISDDPEAYRFDWVGKSSARIDAYRKINKTLRPDFDSSLDFNSTENLYIEGDNLDVLKLLQQSYFKKIKLIYIDPPYNTGHDFIYKDRFEMDSEEYAEAIDLFDENGNRKFVENSDSNPRFHSDWCSMIYSRLLLARNLLSDDGVIFISIDDNEQSNLKKICDEVFGESNFRNTIITRRRVKSLNAQFADNGLSTLNVGFEYILIYARSNSFLMKAIRAEKSVIPEKGHWDAFWSNADRPTMRYELLGFTPASGQWRNSKEKAEIAIENYRIYLEKFSDQMSLEEYYQKTGIKDFIRRIENSVGKNGGVQHWMPPASTILRTSNWMDLEVSQIAKEIKLPFDNPKNKNLIMELIRLADLKDGEIVLDFFSGSATTAHAVMQLNSEDHGSRKFIMVQLPEICPKNSEAFKSGFKNICEIGKERIRRAGSNFQNIDRGFRVLKLDSTNFRDVSISPEELTREKLFDLIENIKSDRSPLDLLFECLIDWGIELNLKLELEEFEGSMILNYNSGDLIACFDKNISKSVIEFMASKNPNRVVFRDESFSSDSDKINSREIFKLHSPNTRFKVI